VLKNSLLFVLVFSFLIPSLSFSYEEEPLGNVVAIKRTFKVELHKCMRVFKDTGMFGKCVVNELESRETEKLARGYYKKFTIYDGPEGICKAEFQATKNGYTVNVMKNLRFRNTLGSCIKKSMSWLPHGYFITAQVYAIK